jgi:hypothetical protein
MLFRKSCRLSVNVEKYLRVGQATDGNMALAHCMLYNKGYTHTHTHTLCNTYFPLQQCLHERASKLRLYVRGLPCFVVKCAQQ